MRTVIFVDYWNLQLTLQKEEGKDLGLTGPKLAEHRFLIDWFGLGPTLIDLVTKYASTADHALDLDFQEIRLYTSADPGDLTYKEFALHTLGDRPQTYVSCQDLRLKMNAECPKCHAEIDACPHCNSPISAHHEKGVDTLMVTDLLCMGISKRYDVAILVTQDSDMTPAVVYLESQGIHVIHVGLKHYGTALARQCWAGFDLFPLRQHIDRSKVTRPPCGPGGRVTRHPVNPVISAALGAALRGIHPDG